MPEDKQKYFITYKEITQYLLKKYDVHEGIWGIYVEFKFAGINAGGPGIDVMPASVSAVSKIGIIPFPEESAIAFDAAKLNPSKKGKGGLLAAAQKK